MNLSRQIFLLLNCISLVLASSIDTDERPPESFLEVFLNIYNMNIVPEHKDLVINILGQFETDPFLLINDSICFSVVLKHIYSGFGYEEKDFFYHRSCRLLSRILMARPDKSVMYKILKEAGPIERKDIIEIMIQSGSIPFILDILKERSLGSNSFESILMNKLRS